MFPESILMFKRGVLCGKEEDAAVLDEADVAEADAVGETPHFGEAPAFDEGAGAALALDEVVGWKDGKGGFVSMYCRSSVSDVKFSAALEERQPSLTGHLARSPWPASEVLCTRFILL